MDKNKKVVKLVLGIALIALGLLADHIGLGTGQGFGWKQITALVVGAVLVLCALKCCGSCKK